MKTLEGRLQMSGRSFGFVIPSDPKESDIYISRDALRNAMHGDQVAVRILDEPSSDGRRAEGIITEILHRANTHIAGL